MAHLDRRHCADAVLSLANYTTLVSEVSSPLTEFAARWAQSRSRYDSIIASTFCSKWAKAHRPVLSRKKNGHTLYTRYDRREPNGNLVLCDLRCGQILEAHSSKNTIRLICKKCNYRCTIPLHTTDSSTALGHSVFVKTAFPQTQIRADWALPPSSLAKEMPTPVVKGAPVIRRTNTGASSSNSKAGALPLVPPPTVISRTASLPVSFMHTSHPSPSSSTPLKINIQPRKESSVSSSSQSASASCDPRKRPTIQENSSKKHKKSKKH
jgi:hypothetical protein